ncbi:MAG TPA: SIMPL domain-containing protein [Prolixibacteraceae bacterium]|nr:SIMPL domain-containing protein [Prolixibacteraceae bacterium]
MRTTFTLLFVLAFVFTYAQDTKNFIDLNYIEVTGKAEMEVAPDEIFIQIFINESDYKGKQTLEILERNMLKKLQEIGIDLKKEFAVNDISSNFKDYWIKKTDIFTSKQYQVIVHTAPVAGRVFRELEGLGISNISIEKVDNSEIEKYKKEVKVKAIQAAKEKAESLSGAIGQTIGKAIYIRESEPLYAPVMANTMMKARGMELDASYTEPDIEFEKIKLEYSVDVYFELK